MKTIGKVLRKLIELTPLFAVLIVFIMTTIVLKPVSQYATIRGQMHWHEFWANANGYTPQSGERVEDWGDGRKEKYNMLEKEIEELVRTSKIAELCNKYGSKGLSPKRDIPLLAIGTMWILSLVWIVIAIYAKIMHVSMYVSMKYNKKKQEAEKIRNQSMERRVQRETEEELGSLLRVMKIVKEEFGMDGSTDR